jgi:hypothetical protein
MLYQADIGLFVHPVHRNTVPHFETPAADFLEIQDE